MTDKQINELEERTIREDIDIITATQADMKELDLKIRRQQCIIKESSIAHLDRIKSDIEIRIQKLEAELLNKIISLEHTVHKNTQRIEAARDEVSKLIEDLET